MAGGVSLCWRCQCDHSVRTPSNTRSSSSPSPSCSSSSRRLPQCPLWEPRHNRPERHLGVDRRKSESRLANTAPNESSGALLPNLGHSTPEGAAEPVREPRMARSRQPAGATDADLSRRHRRRRSLAKRDAKRCERKPRKIGRRLKPRPLLIPTPSLPHGSSRFKALRNQ